MRTWFVTAILLLATPCIAADGAKFRPVGFSADSNYFAFEQYGVQDGSGFPYAEIFVLDVRKDEWAKGTPHFEVVESETADVNQARAKARAEVADAIKRTAISVDAEILAANPFTEVVEKRGKITFHDHFNYSMGMFGTPESQGSWTLSVSNIKMTQANDCGEEIFGYKLELKNEKSGETALLHEDKSLPKSRSCALAYDLEAIVQPVGGGDTLVAIIGVYRRGFEGSDRRFIAVPFKFN
jgi:predicted secreted protein